MSRSVQHDGSTVELDVESAVGDRYSAASMQAEPALCCAVDYDAKYLEVLPNELIERDYGCGNPSRYVNEGETVLDLGSGGGKICFIASQIVGPQGQVHGVDMNDDMLALARKHQAEIGDRIGWHNVRFWKGKIQDLALDLDKLHDHLQSQPVQSVDQWTDTQHWCDQLKQEQPMIADQSVDVVLSNCVLNLVKSADRTHLFQELFRVLRRGGRAVISDIVSDEVVPESLRQDPKLWSGCVSGAFEESEFLRAFEDAGFYGVEIVARQSDPWTTIQGIEFRSMTVRAFKGKDGPCLDYNQAVVYNGPWKEVVDDDGHVLHRGVRTAVCGKTFQIYSRSPYADSITPLPPYSAVRDEDARDFDCHESLVRSAKVTKKDDGRGNQLPTGDRCDPDGCC